RRRAPVDQPPNLRRDFHHLINAQPPLEAGVVALLASRPLSERPPDLVRQSQLLQLVLGWEIFRGAGGTDRPRQPLRDHADEGPRPSGCSAPGCATDPAPNKASSFCRCPSARSPGTGRAAAPASA